MKLRQSSYHAFIIWGHGLKHSHSILEELRADNRISIVYRKQVNINNIQTLIDGVYSSDYVPIEHLRGKTKYLLKTPHTLMIVVVKNSSPRVRFVGTGEFRHRQCLTIKNIKDKIRDHYNPRINGVRSEDHVIHASDMEEQLSATLKAVGIQLTLEDFRANENYPIHLPYHIRQPQNYLIKMIPLNQLVAKISVGRDPEKYSIVKIRNTPHYQFVIGNKTVYTDYIRRISEVSTDDHDPNTYSTLINQFKYPMTDDTLALIVATELKSGEYLIIDGVHRAAILANSFKSTNVPVAVFSYSQNQ